MSDSPDDATRQKIDNLWQAFAELESLRGQVKSLETLRVHADLARRAEEYIMGFRTRLADIFQQPEPAFLRFAEMATNQGVTAACDDLLQNPDKYGQIKGWSIGPLNNAARAGILKLSLPAAARTAGEGFNAHQQTGGGGVTREDLHRKAVQVQEKLAAATEEYGSSAKRIDLEMKIAELAREISFRDLAALPKEQYRLVESLRDKYRNLINTVESDPGRRPAAKKT